LLPFAFALAPLQSFRFAFRGFVVMASFQADQLAPAALHSNWVVQKFGGTSVGKFALNIIQQVVEYVDAPRPLE
jgi:hypothetical protein